LIEQPFDKADRAWSRDLAESTDIPIIADEACQGESDVMEIMTCFDGVNVKLQKCGGITPAARMLDVLTQNGKLALMGCMSESSIGCNAAEELIGKCNWADLDGPWLNLNNERLLEDLGYAKYYS
jgi:L-alanine-DL-glutamate epimerase-like enolase superfamily enzyme